MNDYFIKNSSSLIFQYFLIEKSICFFPTDSQSSMYGTFSWCSYAYHIPKSRCQKISILKILLTQKKTCPHENNDSEKILYCTCRQFSTVSIVVKVVWKYPIQQLRSESSHSSSENVRYFSVRSLWYGVRCVVFSDIASTHTIFFYVWNFST